MKKTYITPEIEIILVKYNPTLLTGSGDTQQYVLPEEESDDEWAG